MSEINRTQITGRVDDLLRTRIAAVLTDYLKAETERRGIYWIADFDFPFMADAVIRELGLRLDSTCHIHDREGKQRCIRYVTEWIADE